MTSAAPTPALLEHELSRLVDKRPEVDVIGFRGSWSGPETLRVGRRTCRVVWCPSALAFREELADHGRKDGELLVLFTERPDTELGADVLARLPRQRLQPLDVWSLLEDAFGANRFDRAVSKPGAAGFTVGMPNYPAVYAIRAYTDLLAQKQAKFAEDAAPVFGISQDEIVAPFQKHPGRKCEALGERNADLDLAAPHP